MKIVLLKSMSNELRGGYYMSRFKHSDGLYRKTESPVVESVRQTEGLYKKTKVAIVENDNFTKKDEDAIREMEKPITDSKKILNG